MNVMNIQQQARAQFEKLGWPHRRMEGWQWSDFARAMEKEKQKEKQKENHNAQNSRPEISPERGFKRKEKIYTALPEDMDALTALNIAQAERSDEIIIAQNTQITEPIRINHRAGLGKISITLGENSRATIYEHVHDDGFSHVMTEITLHPHAELTHLRIFDQPATAILAAKLHIDLAAHAQWRAAVIASGAKLQRIDHQMKFSGEKAAAQCSAALIATGSAHCDIGMAADHDAPDCQSISTLRAVLDGEAQGSFRGAANVAPGAKESDVRQLAKALLLSDNARMNAKPQLAIHHDDVQCAHGVAVGALDPSAIFYLQSRAINKKDAQRILLAAFITDLFAHIPEAADLALARLERLL